MFPGQEYRTSASIVSEGMVSIRYFRAQASQDVRRRIATCFVAVSREAEEIAGYSTLSARAWH